MSKRLITLFLAGMPAALLVAGCGGDDDSATASSITKANFVKQADAICKKSEEQIQKDFLAFAKENEDVTKPSEVDYAELVDTVLAPNIEQEVDDIRAIGAPSGEEEKVEALLDAREESVEIAEDDPEALISNGEKVFAESRKLASEYGLEGCASR